MVGGVGGVCGVGSSSIESGIISVLRGMFDYICKWRITIVCALNHALSIIVYSTHHLIDCHYHGSPMTRDLGLSLVKLVKTPHEVRSETPTAFATPSVWHGTDCFQAC